MRTTGCRTSARGLYRLTNAFLICHPAEVLTSLALKMGQPVVTDAGLPQQVELFRELRAPA